MMSEVSKMIYFILSVSGSGSAVFSGIVFWLLVSLVPLTGLEVFMLLITEVNQLHSEQQHLWLVGLLLKATLPKTVT